MLEQVEVQARGGAGAGAGAGVISGTTVTIVKGTPFGRSISTYIDVICFALSSLALLSRDRSAHGIRRDPPGRPGRLLADRARHRRALGIALSAVRKLIEDRELLSRRIGERRVVAVPAQFLEEEVFRHLRGTFTVLADGGLDDEEILRWLFTPDETLRDRRDPGRQPRGRLQDRGAPPGDGAGLLARSWRSTLC